MFEVTPGDGGFLLSYLPFCEFLENSEAYKLWASQNQVSGEHALFFSTLSYSLFVVQSRQRHDSASLYAHKKIRVFRQSAMNARLLDVDPATGDLAAELSEQFALYHPDEELDVPALIDVATALRWNMTIVACDDNREATHKLCNLLDHPSSFMSCQILNGSE